MDETGRFTGQIIQMWDSESKEEACCFSEKYQIDMQKSYSYGDTNGDFSMFELVGNPVAINPTKELLLNIKQNETVRKNSHHR